MRTGMMQFKILERVPPSQFKYYLKGVLSKWFLSTNRLVFSRTIITHSLAYHNKHMISTSLQIV